MVVSSLRFCGTNGRNDVPIVKLDFTTKLLEALGRLEDIAAVAAGDSILVGDRNGELDPDPRAKRIRGYVPNKLDVDEGTKILVGEFVALAAAIKRERNEALVGILRSIDGNRHFKRPVLWQIENFYRQSGETFHQVAADFVLDAVRDIQGQSVETVAVAVWEEFGHILNAPEFHELEDAIRRERVFASESPEINHEGIGARIPSTGTTPNGLNPPDEFWWNGECAKGKPRNRLTGKKREFLEAVYSGCCNGKPPTVEELKLIFWPESYTPEQCYYQMIANVNRILKPIGCKLATIGGRCTFVGAPTKKVKQRKQRIPREQPSTK